MLPHIPPRQPKTTINVLQALRGIAALLVVATHVETILNDNLDLGIPWLSQRLQLSGFGGVGVDIFFIISGFIMVYVGVRYFRGEGSMQDFLSRRFLRIYPIYWLVSLLLIGAATAKTLLLFIRGNSFSESLDFDLQWHRLLGALTLFPTYNDVGNIQPILGVGWTLSYEVFFYLVFALAVGLGFRWALPAVFAIFSVLVFFPLPLGESTLAQFLRNPILLEFPAGMLIGYAVVLQKRFPRPLLLLSVILGLVGFVIDIALQIDYSYHYLSRGIPSFLLVFGLIFWEIQYGFHVPKFLIRLGDASYSIYLIHTIVISYLVVGIISALPALRAVPIEILGTLSFLLASAIGLGLYEKVERPLLAYLMQRYEKRQKRVASTIGN